MCNLYNMTADVATLRDHFGAFEGDKDNLPPFAAIYPDRAAPVLHKGSEGLTLSIMTWGVPPPAKVDRPVTNVRNLASPFWRAMLDNPHQRCLVPVTAFCEWTGVAGNKRKVWFAMKGNSAAPFAFAGLWRETDSGQRTAFLTCEPNTLVGAVHPKAMPVILAPHDYARWLSGTIDDVKALARPFADDAMCVIPES
jgi:putative SOS response-associated peptidase YedK